MPQTVRIALGLKPGDEVAYAIEQGRVILTKAAVGVGEDPFGALNEWHSADDATAYKGL